MGTGRRAPRPTAPRCGGVPRAAGSGLPQRAPPQALAGVDQRAPAEEGPFPDLLTGDRVRGLQLTAGGRAGGRVSGFWEPGGAGAWYLSWLPITGSRPFRLADLLVQRLRRGKAGPLIFWGGGSPAGEVVAGWAPAGGR